MHMNLSTPYTHSPVAGAGLSLSGDTWSLSATAGASAGYFIQYNGSDWVKFDLLGTANTWGLQQTFDGGIAVDLVSGIIFDGIVTIQGSAAGTLNYSIPVDQGHDFHIDNNLEFAIDANTATFHQVTTNSTISWAGATGLVFNAGTAGYEFDIAGSPEVTIAANTMTLENGATDWVVDFSSAGTLAFNWSTFGSKMVVGGFHPRTDGVGTIGLVGEAWGGMHIASTGSVFFGGTTTHGISSPGANDMEVRAPTNIYMQVGSTNEAVFTSAGLDVVNLCKAETFESDVATGTAPIVVASTTLCANLDADTVDGIEAAAMLRVDGSLALSADWDAGAFDIRAESLTADGDNSGAASTIQFTNVSTSAGSGANAALGKVGAGPGNGAQDDWIKVYIGTQAYWLAAWSD